MSGLIPESFIAELLSKVDLVTLVASKIELKKSGANFSACCPFHSEKTPSFTVNQQKQFYHCFGCQAHGDAISFLMEYDGLDFVSAVEELAGSLGMQVPREGRVSHFDDSPFSCMDAAAKFFQQQLRTSDAHIAIEYLKNRGLRGQTAKKFGLGLALSSWDNLLKALSPTYDAKYLNKMGLTIAKNPPKVGFYDRFRGRIIFPIRDVRGRYIAFGGRGYTESCTPKYLNSPETEIFTKGEHLYGLYEARQSDKNLASIILVEGYFDVLMLAQYGIHNAVATLGTALTPAHLNKLFKYTDKIVVCFDGDNAGKKAAEKALQLALPIVQGEKAISFLFLPEGFDPDSFVRSKGEAAFKAALNRAISLADFLFASSGHELDLGHIEGQRIMLQRALKLISNVSCPIYKRLLQKQLNNIVGMDVKKEQKSRFNAKNTATKSVQYSLTRESLAGQGIRILLQNREYISKVHKDDNFLNLNLPDVELFQALIEVLRQDTNCEIEQIRHKLAPKLASHLHKHVLKFSSRVLTCDQSQTFDDLLRKLRSMIRENKISELIKKTQDGKLTDQEKMLLRELLTHTEC